MLTLHCLFGQSRNANRAEGAVPDWAIHLDLEIVTSSTYWTKDGVVQFLVFRNITCEFCFQL